MRKRNRHRRATGVSQAARHTRTGMGLLALLCVQIAAFSVAEAQEYFGEDPGHVELLSTENFEEKVLQST